MGEADHVIIIHNYYKYLSRRPMSYAPMSLLVICRFAHIITLIGNNHETEGENSLSKSEDEISSSKSERDTTSAHYRARIMLDNNEGHACRDLATHSNYDYH